MKIYTKEACERLSKEKGIPLLKGYQDMNISLCPIKFNEIYKRKSDGTRLMIIYIDKEEREKSVKLIHDYIYDEKIPCKIMRKGKDTFMKFTTDYALYHKYLSIERFGINTFCRKKIKE